MSSDLDRPAYHDFTGMGGAERFTLASLFARQIIATTAAFLPGPTRALDVLDVGSGYGDTTAELAQEFRSVIGLEPSSAMVEAARQQYPSLTFRVGGVEDLTEREAYDLVVLDNVYEHLPDHDLALARIAAALRDGGVLYLLVPNRVWPIEAHYRLPFLSWLPLPLASRYLRVTRRGRDYADASYAPTYRSLRRDLCRAGLTARFVLPGDPEAVRGGGWHYRLGIAMLRRFPALWAVSKSLLVVAVKQPAS